MKIKTSVLLFVIAAVCMTIGLFRLSSADKDSAKARIVIDKLMIIVSPILFIIVFIITET